MQTHDYARRCNRDRQRPRRGGLLGSFSCNNRPCPFCEQKRVLLFAKKVTGDVLLAVPHRFWTFSISKAIRGMMLRDRSLLKLISRCAFEAVKQAIKEALPRVSAAGATCGAILAIHTAGNLLQWNPHVHGIVSEGFFDRQGQFHHMLRYMKKPAVTLSKMSFDPKNDRAPPEEHPAA